MYKSVMKIESPKKVKDFDVIEPVKTKSNRSNKRAETPATTNKQ